VTAEVTAHELLVARDPEEAAAFVAELVGRAVVEAVARRGVAHVALSGGKTPLGAYRRLAEYALPWAATWLAWVDERAVPADHPRSNQTAIREALGPALREGRSLRLDADAADLDSAAQAYDSALRRMFGVTEAAVFDVVTLGIGADGHTASLFPGLGSTAVDDRLVVSVPAQPDLGLEARLSLTAPVLQAARLVVVLALGSEKRPAVMAARLPGACEELPARLLQAGRGRVVWVLDEGSAP
jgi:6-phosphogluconolactonase